MPGLDPGIRSPFATSGLDCRIKSGNDDQKTSPHQTRLWQAMRKIQRV